MSFTVTATQGGSSQAGMAMSLLVFTGQSASQPGATAGHQSATANISVTPNASGSYIAGAILGGNGALTAESGTTFLQTGVHTGLNYTQFRDTATGTGGTPELLGATSGTLGISIVACEILAGTGLAIDASTPAPTAYAVATSLTTAAFSPPPGALLALMISTNGAGGAVTMSVTDTSGQGLTWVQQVKSNVAGDGYTGIWTAKVPSGFTALAPQPIPPGFISPASVRFTYRLPYPAPTNLTGSFTGAAGAAAGARGVISGPELLYYPEVPGPVTRPIAFASPAPRVPLIAPAAAAGEAASSTSRGDPFTGRVAASGVFAGQKNTTGSVNGPVAATGLANGFNLGVGGMQGPAAVSGTALGVKVATGSFAGSAAASGAALGSPPVTGSFMGAVAVSALLPGGPPVPPPVLSAPALVVIAPASPVTVTAISLSQPRSPSCLIAPLPVSMASLAGFVPPSSAPPYVLPGTVGYLGPLSALTSYSPPGSGLPGAGSTPGPSWTWLTDGMHVASTNITLDHVHIYGGVYWTGGGTATITNSVIQAGTGVENACFQSRGANGGTLNFSDSTFGWLPGKTVPAGVDVGPVWDGTTGLSAVYNLTRCALSGSPQGAGPVAGSGSQIVNCTISLAQNADSTAHCDGIFNEGAANMLLQGCYIVALPGTNAASAVFFSQASTGIPGCVVTQNYLDGGSFVIHNENCTGLVVTSNVFNQGFFGDAANNAPGTIGQWSGNTHPDGSPVPSP